MLCSLASCFSWPGWFITVFKVKYYSEYIMPLALRPSPQPPPDPQTSWWRTSWPVPKGRWQTGQWAQWYAPGWRGCQTSWIFGDVIQRHYSKDKLTGMIYYQSFSIANTSIANTVSPIQFLYRYWYCQCNFLNVSLWVSVSEAKEWVLVTNTFTNTFQISQHLVVKSPLNNVLDPDMA